VKKGRNCPRVTWSNGAFWLLHVTSIVSCTLCKWMLLRSAGHLLAIFGHREAGISIMRPRYHGHAPGSRYEDLYMHGTLFGQHLMYILEYVHWLMAEDDICRRESPPPRGLFTFSFAPQNKTSPFKSTYNFKLALIAIPFNLPYFSFLLRDENSIFRTCFMVWQAHLSNFPERYVVQLHFPNDQVSRTIHLTNFRSKVYECFQIDTNDNIYTM
jgi:hypothetical protein